MKKQKLLPLGALTAVILLLGAALLLLGGWEEDTGETAAIPLCSFAAEDVDSLHYAGNNLDVTLLKGREGNWLLDSDPTLPLDGDAVEDLVEEMVSLTAERHLAGGDLSELPARSAIPLIEIQITAGEQSLTLQVDQLNEVVGVYYVYDAEGNAYTVASSQFTSLLKAPRQLYAAQTLTEQTAADVTHLTVNDQGFTYADETWTMDDDPDFALDQDEVQRMVNTICELQTDWSITSPDGDYGLETPDVTVTLDFAGGTVLTVRFGALTPDDETLCYLDTDGAPGIVYEVNANYKSCFALTKAALAAASTAETAESTADIIAEAPVGGIDDYAN